MLKRFEKSSANFASFLSQGKGEKLKNNFSQLFPLSLFLFSFSLNQQSLQNWNKTE
jgi:hypothetical protein